MQAADETAEAREVVEDIRRHLGPDGCEPRDFAILFRTNEQPRLFELELRRAKLPYVLVGGMSFYDRKEVRDVLAYLKVLDRPEDEVSLLRIINTPPRGIGQAAVGQLMARAIAAKKPLWHLLAAAGEGDKELSPAALDGLASLRQLVAAGQAAAKRGPLVEMVRWLIGRIDYQAELARAYKDPNDQLARWNSVEEVVNSLGAYESRADRPTLSGFIDEIAIGDRDAEPDKQTQLARNAIALMTLHSAKGLEFPHVYLVGMEEGLLPHHRSVAAEGAAIDEERRLCYVGITRAEDRLTLSLALARMKWGKPRPSIPSRFLFEITGEAEKARAVAQGRIDGSAKNPQRPKQKPSKRPAAAAEGKIALTASRERPAR